MTNLQFIGKMQDRWETEKKKLPRAILTDVENKLRYYSEKDITNLWTHFIETYSQVSPPTYAHIIHAIKELQLNQSSGLTSKRHYVYICRKCSTVYANKKIPLSALCCPECLSEERTISEDDNQKHQVHTYQHKCLSIKINDQKKLVVSRCTMYDKPGADGPMCKTWGVQQSGYKCNDCQCEDCCKKEKNEIEEDVKKNKERSKIKDAAEINNFILDKHSP